jgi:hypothetical protein
MPKKPANLAGCMGSIGCADFELEEKSTVDNPESRARDCLALDSQLSTLDSLK